ncbi:unnamed protein product [Thelazia callipaeda]|uniref:glutathione-specific gamma-glutamylcyclotransferase n=1 Tax=Thelazia callipaeda TaxID=103827 RepID=A0A0N5CLU9_THECL|nr:unnamed protein product [Thelazia callipaeda]
MWVFGYGSLLWYTDFPYKQVVPGIVRGYSRRFWQLSPDHRGTPDNVGSFVATFRKFLQPGRTVTLVADNNGSCWGLAYKVAEEHVSDTIKYLNVREKAGYMKKEILFYPDDNGPPFMINAYMATIHKNPYFTGPTDEDTVVQTILEARGPSGTNIEYVLRLADCLHRMASHINDEYLFSIEKKVLDACRQRNIQDEYLKKYNSDA